MLQRYTVFSNDRKLIISGCSEPQASEGNSLNIRFTNADELANTVAGFLAGRSYETLFVDAEGYFAEACNSLNSLFVAVKAAGGVVLNENAEVLFIRRFGRWDLPKGKMNKGETEQECALREVQEETGLHRLAITGALPSSFHLYQLRNGKMALKETRWFSMKLLDNEPLVPQNEEDITECRWFGRKEVASAIRDTYASLRHVLAVVMDSEAD